jgi:hypothetical protein
MTSEPLETVEDLAKRLIEAKALEDAAWEYVLCTARNYVAKLDQWSEQVEKVRAIQSQILARLQDLRHEAPAQAQLQSEPG